MSDIAALMADNLDVWTGAIERKSGAGRGGGKRISLYGIERLRALILDLAVRGKLVPQDMEDEPASELLKQVAQARNRKILAGEVRKPKAFAALPSNLSSLPPGWVWTQLAAIAEINPSNSVANDVDASFVPMTLVSTSVSGKHKDEVRNWGEIKKGFTQFADGDLGLAKITPCFENGKAAIFQNLANGIGAGTTELHVARPWLNELNRRYLLLTMKTGSYLSNGEKLMTGTAGQKRVTRSYFEATPLPLPPLAEQQRIVAKVDELMALCDALERDSAGSMAAHQALVEILLATLVNSADATDLARDWARLERHFDTLFTTNASIDTLKQTILALAVRGKLADQDGADEPAAALLKNVEKQRAALLKKNFPNAAEANTQLKKQNIQKIPIGLPKLPHGWDWATLMQCSMLVIDCKNKTAPYADEGVRLIRTTNVRHGQLNAKDQRFVNDETFEKWSLRAKPIAGDLLITREAPMGEACLIPEGELICLGQRMMLARFIPGTIIARYILITFMAPDLMERVQDKPIGMTVEHLRVGGVETLLVPIPPLAEQRRIVAKVDALLALCDALKARLADAAQTQRHLADAITQRAAA
ncbi:type I restriction enzyme S subunit [Sphingomonas aerolata]|uniref:Type I restriction enzyme S subunit n=1 Tax=Sphingomonas aerolata TaxID=185951 RepID=A0A2T4YPP4_9SPHN|nr:restriction endonuclease subunit S [Sphingomonas aerolata]PTM45482.1 type I restriction enzyme S subunit [Sphingomonas aerolata]